MAKPPAQILFDRLVHTWIAPAAQERVKDPSLGPFPLHLAAVIWRDDNSKPEVHLNSEVHPHVHTLRIVASGPLPAGAQMGAEHVAGLHSVTLRAAPRTTPFIFVILGIQRKYFVLSRNTQRVLKHRDFDVLSKTLARDGVSLENAEAMSTVYFDFVRNLYDGLSRGQKAAETKQAAKLMADAASRNAPERVRRHMQLPVVIVHHDEGDFVKLLAETRQTFIDGHYFSATASAVTTADLVCIHLAYRYQLDRTFRRKLLAMTFGQKIQPLRSKGVFTEAQEQLLVQLNNIRKRNLHPRRRLTERGLKRDALQAVLLLHQILEGTFSVFRDYAIKDGRLTPRPLA
jgi:hypothetical protein